MRGKTLIGQRYPLRRDNGGGSIGVETSAPEIIDVGGSLALDIESRFTDLLVQAGDASLSAGTFDPALAHYFATSVLGTEPLAFPPGTEKVAIRALQRNAAIRTRSASLRRYVGDQQAMYWANRASKGVYGGKLARAISAATYPITMIVALAPTFSSGNTQTIAALTPAPGSTLHPAMRLRVSSAGRLLIANTTPDAGGAGKSTSTGNGFTNDGDMIVVALTITAGGALLRCESIYNGARQTGSSVATITIDAEALTHLVLGGENDGATNPAHACQVLSVLVGDFDLFDTAGAEFQEFMRFGCASPRWWPLLLTPAHQAKVIGYWPCREITGDSSGPLRDVYTGQPLAYVGTGGAAGNMVVQDPLTTPPWKIRPPNRLSGSVLNLPYSEVASGDYTPTANPCGLLRAAVHHALRYDVGASPNPATQHVVLSAGTRFAYSPGGSAQGKLDIINDSGAATDVDSANFSGTTYAPGDHLGEFELLDAGDFANIEFAPCLYQGRQYGCITEDLGGGVVKIWLFEVDLTTGRPYNDDLRQLELGTMDANYLGTGQWGTFGQEVPIFGGGTAIVETPFVGYLSFDASDATVAGFLTVAIPDGALGASSTITRYVGADDPFPSTSAGDRARRAARQNMFPERSTLNTSPVLRWYERSTGLDIDYIRSMKTTNPARHFTDEDQTNYDSSTGGLTNLTDPFTTTNGSNLVTVADTAHGVPKKQWATFTATTTVGGLNMNGTFPVVSVTNANAYVIQHTGNASSAQTAGGTVTVNYGQHGQPAMLTGFLKSAKGNKQGFTIGRHHSPAAAATVHNHLLDSSGRNWATDAVDTDAGLVDTDITPSGLAYSLVDSQAPETAVDGKYYYVAGHGAPTASGDFVMMRADTIDGAYSVFMELPHPSRVSALYGFVNGAQSCENVQFDSTLDGLYGIGWGGDPETFVGTKPLTPNYNGEVMLWKVSTGHTMRMSDVAITEAGKAIIESEVVICSGIAYAYHNVKDTPSDVRVSPVYWQRLGTKAQIDAALAASQLEQQLAA